MQLDASRGVNSSGASVVVGIATRNRAKILLKAIASARTQSHSPTRVHVFDDCSDDGACELRQTEPDVTWEVSAAPVGIIKARNQLMLQATEDFYVSLDDDAWFIKGDEVEIAVRYLQDNPWVGAVAFDILTPDADKIRPRGRVRSVSMFIGCGHVIRLDLARQLRGYKVYPGFYGGEEQDFCLKLLDLGFSVALLEGVHVWHDKTMMGRDIATQHRSGVCNDLSRIFVRFPAAVLVPAVFLKFLSHLRFAKANKLVRPTLEGTMDFVGSMQELLRLREPVSWRTIRKARKIQGVTAPTPLDTWKKFDRSLSKRDETGTSEPTYDA